MKKELFTDIPKWLPKPYKELWFDFIKSSKPGAFLPSIGRKEYCIKYEETVHKFALNVEISVLDLECKHDGFSINFIAYAPSLIDGTEINRL
jgi:hypothetical protein